MNLISSFNKSSKKRTFVVLSTSQRNETKIQIQNLVLGLNVLIFNILVLSSWDKFI